jgi:hypothetical protein
LLTLEQLADQAGCPPLLTSSPWPSGPACVGLVHRAGRDRQSPSERRATFQYVLIADSTPNSSVKVAAELSLFASMEVSCGSPRFARMPHSGLPRLHARHGAVTVPWLGARAGSGGTVADITANPWSAPCKS